MNFKTELRWLYVILFFTITMLALAVFYANQNYVEVNNNFKKVSKANQTIAEIYALESNIYRTESLVRFFVISRDYELLKGQYDDNAGKATKIMELMASGPDVSSRLDTLAGLVSARFVLWNELINLPQSSPQIVAAIKNGSAMTERIMRETGALRATEQQIVSSYSEHTRLGVRTMIMLIGGSIVFSISLFLYAFFRLTSQVRREALIYEQLQRKNIELDRSNKELEYFAYAASHDLQVPLRMMHVYSGKLAESEAENLSEEGQQTITRLQGFAKRMQQLIDDLLSFSRMLDHSSVQKTAIDLNKVSATVRQSMAPAILTSNATITTDTLPVLTGYESQMVQLFQNLIGNSIKYARENVPPEVRISVSTVKGAEIKDKRPMDRYKNFYKFVFTDNGIGFDNIYSEKIFIIFQRLHGRSEYSGTGIGLSICKRVVQNHEGYIEASGVEGEGAVFTIYLPV